jgi:hypothetical protein
MVEAIARWIVTLMGGLLLKGADPAKTADLMGMVFDFLCDRAIEIVAEAGRSPGAFGHA